MDEEHEAEADRFAADQWIPPAAAQKLQGLRSEQEEKAAAMALGIAPGIVGGACSMKAGCLAPISMD